MTNPDIPKVTPAEDLTQSECIDDTNTEIIHEDKVSGALLSQRAIIASEVFWGIGIGDFSRGDPRSSRYMEP